MFQVTPKPGRKRRIARDLSIGESLADAKAKQDKHAHMVAEFARLGFKPGVVPGRPWSIAFTQATAKALLRRLLSK